MFIATVHSCRLLREKPNSSQITLESMILYKRNKTADWLKTKSDEEKKMFQACSGVARAMELVGHHCACAKKLDHTHYLISLSSNKGLEI